MKKTALILSVVIFSCNSPVERKPLPEVKKSALTQEHKKTPEIQEGDIIFQSTSGGQGKAIQIATGSTYSHVGIVFKEDNDYVVFEAVQPVKITPLKEWIDRGDNDHFVLKRLREAETYLTEDVLKKMKAESKKHLGKNYDLYFGWADDRLYCSELVWKMYHEVLGIELGELQQLKDFNLSNPIVQYKLKERYGKKIPYEEEVISPASIYESDQLVEVSRN